MSRIGMIHELHALRKACAELEARCVALDQRADYLLGKYLALIDRIEALEAKRTPGRPKKDE